MINIRNQNGISQIGGGNHNLTSSSEELKRKEIQSQIEENRYFFIEKQFAFKQSLISNLFQLEHVRTIYNIVVATFIALGCNLTFNDWITKNQLLDMEAFHWCFSGKQKIIFPWLKIAFVSYLCAPIVIFIKEKNFSLFYGVILYGIQVLTMLYLTVYYSIHLKDELGFGAGMILNCEHIRMQLKVYSYYRN